jgi:hypothetical protein
MNKYLNDTVFYVTGKGELQTTEKSDIENLLKEHPYFAPAQLLLVAKLKNENSYNIKEQTQKASLFFNNSRWFQYQLTEINIDKSNFDYKGIESVTNDIKPIESLSSNIVINDNENLELNVNEANLSYNEIFIPNFSIPTVEHVKNIFDGIDAKEDVELKNIVEEEKTETTINNKVEPIEIIEKENDVIVDKGTTIVPESLGVAEIKENWDKPIDDSKEALLPFETEPYYTIDYFASQGIQFDFSKHPHDKLTTKMLKFTDWLKKMKGIKPENIEFEEDVELTKTIQNIAFNSNVSKEIVTETMAEVFAKQGKTEKAIQLYIKLSFLIPNKSSYFATKIQELKGI